MINNPSSIIFNDSMSLMKFITTFNNSSPTFILISCSPAFDWMIHQDPYHTFKYSIINFHIFLKQWLLFLWHVCPCTISICGLSVLQKNMNQEFQIDTTLCKFCTWGIGSFTAPVILQPLWFQLSDCILSSWILFY